MKQDEFIYKQNKIYKEIEECSLKLDKLKRSVFCNQGGYIIALRHSKDIIEIIKEINKKIEKIIRIMYYDECNIHTTMATYHEQTQFEPDEQILDKISDILLSASYDYEKMKICYYNFLLDYSSLILAGEFNKVFYKNCENVISSLRNNKMIFKYPWGIHITVCRFLEDGNQEQVQEVKRLISDYKRELQSVPPSIDIGYYINDGKKFELYTYKKILL